MKHPPRKDALYVLGLLASPRLGLELGLELVPALPPLLEVSFGVHPLLSDGRLFAWFGTVWSRSDAFRGMSAWILNKFSLHRPANVPPYCFIIL